MPYMADRPRALRRVLAAVVATLAPALAGCDDASGTADADVSVTSAELAERIPTIQTRLDTDFAAAIEEHGGDRTWAVSGVIVEKERNIDGDVTLRLEGLEPTWEGTTAWSGGFVVPRADADDVEDLAVGDPVTLVCRLRAVEGTYWWFRPCTVE